MENIRIQKIIADSGYCSRRKAEELIEQKRVKVNGHPAIIGQKLNPKTDIITIDGERVAVEPEASVHLSCNEQAERLYHVCDGRQRPPLRYRAVARERRKALSCGTS